MCFGEHCELQQFRHAGLIQHVNELIHELFLSLFSWSVFKRESNVDNLDKCLIKVVAKENKGAKRLSDHMLMNFWKWTVSVIAGSTSINNGSSSYQKVPINLQHTPAAVLLSQQES